MKRRLRKTDEQRRPGAASPQSPLDRPLGSTAIPTHSGQNAGLGRGLSEVFRLQHEPLVRFLSRRAGSREEAEDIIQDAYVRILAVDRTEEIRELQRYVWRSALNIATDHGRAHQRWNRVARMIVAEEAQIAPSAEVAADACERWTLLTQGVSELPPREYQAFILRIAQSLPFEEVGHAMQISPRMAKIYVARTLVYLRCRLEGGAAPQGATTRRRSRAVAATGFGDSVIQKGSDRTGADALARLEPRATEALERRLRPQSAGPP